MPGMTAISLVQALRMKVSLIELKIDGSRHTWDNGLFSDRKIERSGRFPHIAEDLNKIPWKIRGEVALPQGNVLQLNKRVNWDRARFYPFEVITLNGEDCSHFPIAMQRELLKRVISEYGLTHLAVPQAFNSVNEGWGYVKETKSEGLVLKTESNKCYKLKLLQEEKLPIVGYKQGKSKGAFIIERNGGVQSRVSGTAGVFVDAYKLLLEQGKAPYAEIEYQFLTDYGIPFQPRLRRVGTLQDLIT